MKVAIICCGRLENRYALEFVEYHYNIGINHIFICDNNRNNEEHFEDVLQEYINKNVVTILNYRNDPFVQLHAYIDVYYKISNEYDWIICLDFDEFIYLRKDKTIQEYLSRDCFKRYNQILVNWKIYTDNNLIYDDGRPCLERFTTPMEIYKCTGYEFPENEHVKPIIRSKIKHLQFASVHYFTNQVLTYTTCNSIGKRYSPNFHTPIEYNLIYIKHFTTKTIDEWVNHKLKRGTGDMTMQQFFEYYSIDKFFDYNERTSNKIKFLKGKY